MEKTEDEYGGETPKEKTAAIYKAPKPMQADGSQYNPKLLNWQPAPLTPNPVQQKARPHAPIKTFVRRSGRITESQKKNYETLYSKWSLPYSQEKLNIKKIFKNDNPLIIEIGFGMGNATAEIAKNNTDKNYIGIEVFKAGVGKLLGEIKAKGLKNLRIIEYDAVEVLQNMIEDESLYALHIFFPDPWQKKRNHKRRLVHRPKTDLFASKLKPGGYIYMVTDWQDYAEDAFNHLSATPRLNSKYKGFAEPQPWRPLTKFEKKGLQKNHTIRELMFKKV